MAAAIAMLKASIAISDTANFTLPTVGWIPGLALHEQGSVAARAHVHRALRGVRRAQRRRARCRRLGRRDRAGRRGHHGRLRADRFADRTFEITTSRSRLACARSPGDYMRGGYWLVGPADSTDGWKNWVATPVANRVAFQMRTQDRRIIGAGGPTTAGQYFAYNTNIAFFNPTRGTYLQTFYYYLRYGAGTTCNNGPLVAIGRTEMDMLKAEALDSSQSRGRSGSAHQQDARGERQAAGRSTSTVRPTSPDACRARRPARAAACGTRCATRNESKARASTDKWRIWDARGWNTLAAKLVHPVPDSRLASSRFSGSRSTRIGGGGAGSAPPPTWDKCPAGVTWRGARNTRRSARRCRSNQTPRRADDRSGRERRRSNRRDRPRAQSPAARSRRFRIFQARSRRPICISRCTTPAFRLIDPAQSQSSHSRTGRSADAVHRSPTSSDFRRSRARTSSNAPATACWRGAAACSESRIPGSRRNKSRA